MDLIVMVAAVATAMVALERLAPGRTWQVVDGWWVRALLLNTAQALIVLLAGVTWDRWLGGYPLMDVSALSNAAGALIGYLAITFVYYWWHRARHEVPLLWRWLHQVHHSPQRLEVITSFYKHPLEMLLNSILSSTVLFVLLGCSPAQAASAVLLTALVELFYHWNVRTPRWLGYLIQRPESHCVHHRAGHHRQNYSDLPLWDLLFGTFHNPHDESFVCGFDEGTERHLGHLLLGRKLEEGGRT